MRNLYEENLRLLKEIEDSVKDVLEEAEAEIRAMSPQQRKELFGMDDLPSFDDPMWGDLFPLGSEEGDEEEF